MEAEGTSAHLMPGLAWRNRYLGFGKQKTCVQILVLHNLDNHTWPL